MKLLLITIVYLMHCEESVTTNWWYEVNNGADQNMYENMHNKPRKRANLNPHIDNGAFSATNNGKVPVINDARIDIRTSSYRSIDTLDTIITGAVESDPSKRELANDITKIVTSVIDCTFKNKMTSNTEEKSKPHGDSALLRDDSRNSVSVELSGLPVSSADFNKEQVVYTVSNEDHTSSTKVDRTKIGNRPIIGILSQEQSKHLETKYPKENYTSYIAASYVKLVESSGARVVPIMIGKDRTYYNNLMRQINGVLLPGGATYFNQSNGFADAGQHIYEIAQQMNDAGDYFPIFGICLGFELLIVLASGRGSKENRVSCKSFSNTPLKMAPDSQNSKMFQYATPEVVRILSEEDVTVNAHQFCITTDNLNAHNLSREWRVNSFSNDNKGLQFISSIENKRYPFYGVQFHPEKPAFEWKPTKTYPHSENAIVVNRYFMDFFTREARKSDHSFENVSEENECLIYNYVPTYTGLVGSAYLQCYFFEPQGSGS